MRFFVLVGFPLEAKQSKSKGSQHSLPCKAPKMMISDKGLGTKHHLSMHGPFPGFCHTKEERRRLVCLCQSVSTVVELHWANWLYLLSHHNSSVCFACRSRRRKRDGFVCLTSTPTNSRVLGQVAACPTRLPLLFAMPWGAIMPRRCSMWSPRNLPILPIWQVSQTFTSKRRVYRQKDLEGTFSPQLDTKRLRLPCRHCTSALQSASSLWRGGAHRGVSVLVFGYPVSPFPCYSCNETISLYMHELLDLFYRSFVIKNKKKNV